MIAENVRRKKAAALKREYLGHTSRKAARLGRRQTRKGISRSFFVILTERMENALAPEMRIPARTEGKERRIFVSGRANPPGHKCAKRLEGGP